MNPHIKKSDVRTANADVYLGDFSVIIHLSVKVFEYCSVLTHSTGK
jgi:hypothetical protein